MTKKELETELKSEKLKNSKLVCFATHALRDGASINDKALRELQMMIGETV